MRAQEVYNQYCRKEISGQDLLYWLRRDPIIKEHISPLNSTEDAIKILKNKALISEQVANEDYLIIQEKEVEDGNKEIAPESPEYGEEIGESYDDEEREQEIEDTYGTDEARDALERNDLLGFDSMGAAMNAILLHKDWANRWDVQDPSDVNILNTWRKASREKASQKKPSSMNENSSAKKELNADQVNYFEFTRGWRYEYEKNPKIKAAQDIDKAKAIALKNLNKDPMFYNDLLMKQTKDKQKSDPIYNKTKILKAPTDQTEFKDKANQMKATKKNVADKSNVKTNLGNQEKAKGTNVPKGVKALKENIRKELRSILKEAEYVKRYDDIMQHAKLDAMMEVKDLTDDEIKKNAEETLKMYGGSVEKAVQTLDHLLYQMKHNPHMDQPDKEKVTKNLERSKEYLLRGIDKPVKANKNNFSTNENEYDDHINDKEKLKKVTDHFIKLAGGSKEKAVQLVTKHIKDAESSRNKASMRMLVQVYKKVLSGLTGKETVKANPSTFSTNEAQEDNEKRLNYGGDNVTDSETDYGGDNLTMERTTVGDFETWKKSVIDLLKTALKTDDKAAGKIFGHYAKDFKANHEAGKDPKSAVKSFAAGLKKLKEAGLASRDAHDLKGRESRESLTAKGQPKALKEGLSKEEANRRFEHANKVLEDFTLLIDKIVEGKTIKEDSREQDLIKKKADALLRATKGSKQKAIEACDKAIKNIDKDFGNSKHKDEILSNYKKVKAYLSGQQEVPVKADLKTFSPNEEFQDNTAPEKTNWQDVELGSELNEKKYLKENNDPLVKEFLTRVSKAISLAKKYTDD